jgi:hypothetical protein
MSNEHLKLEAIVNTLTIVGDTILLAPVLGLPLAVVTALLDVVMIGFVELREPLPGSVNFLFLCVPVSDVLTWMRWR